MKDISVKKQEAHRATNGQVMKRTFPWNVIIKTLSNRTKKVLKAAREKNASYIERKT